MAKQRMINTRFWIDDYISNLDPIEKLLFLYFLTNPSTDICGIYEIPLKTIATDTGIEIEMVKKILRRFGRDKRIYYVDGWLGIKNFAKHQSDNPSVKKGIENGLLKAPQILIDRLSTGSIQAVPSLSHLNLNSNSNLNPNTAPTSGARKKVSFNPQGAEIIKAFEEIDIKNKQFYKNTTERTACDFLIENYGLREVIDLIPKLKETNKKSVYQITTPKEMVDKITKVFNDIGRKKVELKSSVAF